MVTAAEMLQHIAEALAALPVLETLSCEAIR
jgi:hypothetical protein